MACVGCSNGLMYKIQGDRCTHVCADQEQGVHTTAHNIGRIMEDDDERPAM